MPSDATRTVSAAPLFWLLSYAALSMYSVPSADAAFFVLPAGDDRAPDRCIQGFDWSDDSWYEYDPTSFPAPAEARDSPEADGEPQTSRTVAP